MATKKVNFLISDQDFSSLIIKLEKLVTLLSKAARDGEHSAGVVEARVNERLRRINEHHRSTNDKLKLVSYLLDIVPSAKDLDAIGFYISNDSEIRKLLSEISIQAAKMASDLLQSD